ncbi:C4-dicarboxylate transporter DcuC [Crenobacter intestini]|uniref:C4-dicarboxylate ABC transporter n=1 Tax=Crenobacter intestini TaxID=2563443 RepID=A0A4T0UVX0_9NEIS|nr:C4-dicarboxylate transporter DcuC [Crenobacter intestini]TIC83088.1 C4-dicarboxylate ABC transporter [Crenobacter intestini]
MELIVVLLVLGLVVYGIIKDYNPQAVLALAGMALFAVAYWSGIHPILPADKSTGFALFDLFEVFKGIFSKRAAALGLTIMAVAGFATYMSHIGASQALVRAAVRPLAGVRSSYVLLMACYLISIFVSLFVTSATGLGLLLMVTMYPVMRNLGISPGAAVGVIASSQAFEIGPTMTNAIFAAGQSGLDPTTYFVDYQVWLVVPMVLVTMLLHYVWQRHCDRRAGWDPVAHRGDAAELDEVRSSEVEAPALYGLLPMIPFVLMMVFSKLMISDVKLSVEVAMLLTVFAGMACELLRTRSLRESLSGFGSFLDGMGKVFGPVVALIVCAELFAESLKAIGAINALLHSADGVGLGVTFMTLVLVGLIMGAAVVMGSGNASFLSFATLAPEVAAKFGVPAVTMLLPMQLASSIGRTVSPIAAVIIACAGIAKVSPFEIVRRTSVPMAGALVTALSLNYAFFM